MKGVHLARVTRAQASAGLRVPLEGVHVETLRLTGGHTETPGVETLFLVLEGEAVLDVPGDFVHLRRGESFTVGAGSACRFSPVQETVLLRVAKSASG